jgi:ABC-type branched-subunit amino acid transport system ATPase component
MRRLEIARALASRPRLLILDEPAAGMAAVDVATLEALIRRIRDAGVTVLLIEHHMDLVMRLCDTVTVLNLGRTLSEGTPGDVAADPQVVEAYLGAADRTPAVAHETPRAPSPATVSGADGAPALAIEQLEVAYGAAPALHGVDITVAEGETVAIIGANGAGKTTTLKAVSGLAELLMSVRGEVRFRGARIDGLPAQKIARLGLVHVPEGRRVFEESTVEENLLLGAHRRRDGGTRTDIDGVYDRFPVLARRRGQAAGLLSGGEQQMLAIGRALVARPSFLLLDEPSLGLAPTVVDELFETIGQLGDDGLSILVVEQLAAKALAVADRAYVLEMGNVVLSGPSAEVAGDREVQVAYLGERPG